MSNTPSDNLLTAAKYQDAILMLVMELDSNADMTAAIDEIINDQRDDYTINQLAQAEWALEAMRGIETLIQTTRDVADYLDEQEAADAPA